MPLPHVKLFEISDSSWAPRTLREFIHESVTRAFDWVRAMRGLVAPFAAFVAAAGVREVLELGAGLGGPSRMLAQAMRRDGREPPRFVLTDLEPPLPAWRELCARLPDLDFAPEPVDATNVPAALAEGRARMVVNALHHFPPDFARQLFADAVASSRGIFIAEPFTRNPLGLLPLTLAALVSFVLEPLLAPRHRLLKLVWLVTLVGPIAALWDGLVSTLRVYDEGELRALVAPLGDRFVWTFGRHRFGLGGRGYYFWGVPRAEAPPRGAIAKGEGS